jgi:outer membrane protein OmpA-like peptidoglycan-associated protein
MSNDTVSHSDHGTGAYPIYDHPYPLTELTLRRHNGYPYIVEPCTTLDAATASTTKVAAATVAAAAPVVAAAQASTAAAAQTAPAHQAHKATEARPQLDVTSIKPDVSRTMPSAPAATHAPAAKTETQASPQAATQTAGAARTQAAASSVKHEARTETRAAQAPAAATPRRHEDEDRPGAGPWFGWAAGIGAVLAALGLLAYNHKSEPAKQAVTAQVTETKTAVVEKVVPKVEAVVEAAKEKVAEAEAPKAKAEPEPAPAAEPAPAPAAEPVAEAKTEAAPAPVANAQGVTNYYGVGDGSQVLAWSADATMNPEYAEAEAEAAAPVEPEAQAGDAEGTAPVAAEPEAAPVSLGGVGVTSFYGSAETPDKEQAWAAEAEMNEDYEAAAAEAPEAAEPAAPEVAPVSLGGVGVTSYYGDGQTPDAGKPWSADASMNPDYTAEAPAPAAVAVEEASAPVSLGGVGVTSFYGGGSSWTAPENYMAPVEVAAAPAPAPVAEPEPPKTAPGVTSTYGGSSWTPPANYYAPVEAAPVAKVADPCNDAVAAALKSGKLNFATSSWEILDDSYPTLDKIAKLIKGCAGAAVEVGGHTDNTGLRDSNQVLSEQRAKSVVRYLTGAGVSASQLKAVGYGQDKPVADNTTAAGKRENRRIEFVVTGK